MIPPGRRLAPWTPPVAVAETTAPARTPRSVAIAPAAATAAVIPAAVARIVVCRRTHRYILPSPRAFPAAERSRGPYPDGSALNWKFVRRCPTLPHRPRCSTIGAGGLSFRVRNVAGRFPSAMTAVTLSTLSNMPVRFGRGCLPVVMRMVNARALAFLRPAQHAVHEVCVGQVLGLLVPVH